jgi:hypothetical protein
LEFTVAASFLRLKVFLLAKTKKGQPSVTMQSDIRPRSTPSAKQDAHQKKGVEMYSNDLNNAYAYECERRNDERRAAAESLRTHELLGGKRKPGLLSPMAVVGVLVVLAALVRAL